jgi:hypothetical protein
VKSPKKLIKIKKHDVPDLYRSLHQIRFYLEFCLQFWQHGKKCRSGKNSEGPAENSWAK